VRGLELTSINSPTTGDLSLFHAITDPTNSEHTVAEVALKLAHLGVSVMPVNAVTKKPLLDTWKALQTRVASLKQVEEWFGQWPEAALGVITGALNGISVLDLDVGTDGEPPGWISLLATNFNLPTAKNPTPIVKTPSGGYHLYYPFNPDLPQGAGIWGLTHVDGRGEGGYVVAPPSPGYIWRPAFRSSSDRDDGVVQP